MNTRDCKPIVHVAAGNRPYENTRQALAEMDLSIAGGSKVLLKPNAGRMAKPESGITTHPDVVAAAIDAFIEAGAEVAIGESPITGVKTPAAFEITGIAEIARTRGCELIDMDAREGTIVPVPEGIALNELKVCAAVLEHDIVVSIPVAKMHMHTGVTLAVKNMKGCLWRRSKVDLHMLAPVEGSDDKSLNIAIADMASVLRPHLAIIDGTVGMEGMGPGAGEPRRLDVVVVGTDAFAADAIACRLMGTQAENIPHLRMGAERGYGIIDMHGIETSPANWLDWQQEFAPAPDNIAIKYPNVEVLDRNSCSACQSTVLLFLKHHANQLFEYFGESAPVRIAIGKGHDDVPPGTLCIGNCTAAHREKNVFVAGCPPVGSAIEQALQDE